jgi:hypothetical protein
MYLVLFLDQQNYEFITSLHTTRVAAEAAGAEMLRQYEVVNRFEGGRLESDEPLPPSSEWEGLFDAHGEGVHLYEIEPDGGLAEEITLERGAKAA